MMQTLKSRLDYKAVDKNYVAEIWSINIDTQQEQMPLLNCMFDKLSTGQPYSFSEPNQPGTVCAHNRSGQNQMHVTNYFL